MRIRQIVTEQMFPNGLTKDAIRERITSQMAACAPDPKAAEEVISDPEFHKYINSQVDLLYEWAERMIPKQVEVIAQKLTDDELTLLEDPRMIAIMKKLNEVQASMQSEIIGLSRKLLEQ